MKAEVKILIEGFTNIGSSLGTGKEKATPTITLIKDEDLVMVVDPGVLENQKILVDALNKENLTVDDVDVVCLTHSHLDHFRNIGMFPNAKTLEYGGLWDKNTVEPWSENFTPNIKVLHTPGHDYSSISFFVETKDGVVAICGDVFWNENFPKESYDDAYASNPEKLKESRNVVLKNADWIVPGHGPIYKNNINAVPKRKEKSETFTSKIIIKCKKCGVEMDQKDKCQCRPFICYRCCECKMDCDLCSCSHKIR